MNSVNLLTYFTVRPAVKLPMALPNAHTAIANPTYLTPIHWTMNSYGVESNIIGLQPNRINVLQIKKIMLATSKSHASGTYKPKAYHELPLVNYLLLLL